jgi:hypothetical protein
MKRFGVAFLSIERITTIPKNRLEISLSTDYFTKFAASNLLEK